MKRPISLFHLTYYKTDWRPKLGPLDLPISGIPTIQELPNPRKKETSLVFEGVLP